MFEDLEVPEQAYSHQARIAILRYDRKTYAAKVIDEFFEFDKKFLVKDMKLSIPRSHIERVGEEYFNRFLASAFKLMSKRECHHPLAVLNPLRKKLRRIKLRLLRINPNNSALCWYLSNLYDMIKGMWVAARNNYLRLMCDHKAYRKEIEILKAGTIS